MQPALETRWWVKCNASLPLCEESGSPLRKAVFNSPLSNKCLSLTIHCKIDDSPSGVRVGGDVGSVVRRGSRNPSAHNRAFGTFSVPKFFHVSTQRSRRMWLRGTFNRSITSSTAALSSHEAHSFYFAAMKASRSSLVRFRIDTSTRRFSALARSQS